MVAAVGVDVEPGVEVGSDTSVEVVVPAVEEVAASGSPSAWPSPLLQAAAVINTAKAAASTVLKPIPPLALKPRKRAGVGSEWRLAEVFVSQLRG